MTNANREQAYQNMLSDIPEENIPLVNSIPPLYYQMQDYGKFSIGVNEFTVMMYHQWENYERKNKIIGWCIVGTFFILASGLLEIFGEDVLFYGLFFGFLSRFAWHKIKGKNRDKYIIDKITIDLENSGEFVYNNKKHDEKTNNNPNFTYTRGSQNTTNNDQDFDFDPSAFSSGKSQKNTAGEAEVPYGVDKRHPEDAKLWAVVDSPSSSDQERMNALSMILKKQAKREGKKGTDLKR